MYPMSKTEVSKLPAATASMEYRNGENTNHLKPTLMLPNLQNIGNHAATTMRKKPKQKG
jgi:hypothetical protein